MVHFIGIHHKNNLPALCSSTRSGKKIDQVMQRLSNCRKINLFSTNHKPSRGTVEFATEINKFIGNVPDSGILVLLGKDVQKEFPYHLYKNAQIIKYRHPSFSRSDYSDSLFKEVSNIK